MRSSGRPATFTLASGNEGPPRWRDVLDMMGKSKAHGGQVTADAVVIPAAAPKAAPKPEPKAETPKPAAAPAPARAAFDGVATRAADADVIAAVAEHDVRPALAEQWLSGYAGVPVLE